MLLAKDILYFSDSLDLVDIIMTKAEQLVVLAKLALWLLDDLSYSTSALLNFYLKK